MIGGQEVTNTLSVTSQDGLLQKTTRTIGADCLNQQNFNDDVFSASVISSNMRQIYAASTNTYVDTVYKSSVSISVLE